VIQNRSILVLMAVVTIALGWVLLPLFGAVFWALVFVIVFAPLARRLTFRMGQRRNLAALTMVAGFVLLIIVPTFLILTTIFSEAKGLVKSVQSGEIDLHQMFETLLTALPDWTRAILSRTGLGELSAVQASAAASTNDWIGANAPTMLSFGQNTAGAFVGLGVTLYLMFFLFRDGDALMQKVKSVIPMEADLLEDLIHTFTLTVRATVRGDILVALLQGTLGGLGFWLLGIHAAILWTVLISLLSLFPVFGAALVWGPMSVYLLANGLVWQGIVLIIYGVAVISLIDNIARPWLVGQATRMPDYVVLTSTIGGISTFGMQGFITGPVIAAMFIAVWSTYIAQSKAKQSGLERPRTKPGG
jgi:predicted PurR-regulated permease PerM